MSEILIPKSSQGRDMSPFEVRTGVVLPIYAPGEGKTNRHHPHFYRGDYETGPRKNETRGLRYSRLQLIRKGPHRVHHEEFDGTAFPSISRDSFMTILFNLAEYVPPYVIDMSGETTKIVETTPAIRDYLRRPGTFTLESKQCCRAEIGQFLMSHAIWQDFSTVDQDCIAQFLETTTEKALLDEDLWEKKVKLGTKLMDIALGMAVGPVDEQFRQACSEQAVSSAAPERAFGVVKKYVAGYETDYFRTLEDRLAYHTAA